MCVTHPTIVNVTSFQPCVRSGHFNSFLESLGIGKTSRSVQKDGLILS